MIGKLKHLATVKSPFRRLLRLVLAQKLIFSALILTAVASNLIVLLGPRLIGQAIDQMTGPGQVFWTRLHRLVVLLVVLFLSGSVSQWFLHLITTLLAARTVKELREKAYKRISGLAIKDIDKRSHGDLVSRLTHDMDMIMDGLLSGLSHAFTGLITLVGSFIFMLMLNPWITLFVVALTPLSFKLAGYIARNSRQKFREQSETAGELNGLAEEAIENMPLIQVFQAQDSIIGKYMVINRKLYHSGQKAQFYSSMTNPVTRVINHTAYVSVAILASLLVIAGRLTVGLLASFLLYTNQFARPINDITNLATQLQSAIASAKRVFDIIDLPEEPDDSHLPQLNVDRGEIEFTAVYFSYNPGRPLIENLNLKISSGQMVAIVGPTGAGKTTLVNLIMRFYDLDGGTIQVDGQNNDQVARDSLRSSFGMVLQDTWLFTGSIRDNIAFGKPDAAEEEIIAAARAARAHSFIHRLQDGYDTWIGSGHTHLSQGQQQLLTIARAFLAAPPLLILDEATSSVDTHTEIQIQEALRQLMHGRTSLVIAHRLSTIRDADLILVMNQGRVIEQGTHQQLLRDNGFYAGLLKKQYAGVEDNDIDNH